jgi:cell division septation protein DedD
MISPLLIDSRGLLKLGFSLTLTVVLVFGGGVFVGFQRATTIHSAADDTQVLVLPEQVVVSENSLSAYPPEKVEAGEKIDVDEPESVSAPVPAPVPVSSKPIKNVHTAIKTLAKKQQSMVPGTASKHPENGDSKTPPAAMALSKETIHDSPPSAKVKHISAATNNDAIIPSPVKITNTKETNDIKLRDLKLRDIKYSVQVGMYGRLYNADNMVKMLQAQQFDAYISDYKNKKNEVRYNVRFGYFTNRKSAIQRLKKFKDDQVGDGYLVRFSADNIVNTEGVVTTAKNTEKLIGEEKPASEVAISNILINQNSHSSDSNGLDLGSLDSGRQNMSDHTAAEHTADNISQAETSSVDVLLKSETKTN